MDLAAALAYLDAHLNREATAGKIEGLTLDHMARLAHVLGDPQAAFPVIHITGTNGKGSVARMITALLVESGLSVGTYSSPHLVELNERMAWNGEPISDHDLADAISEVAAVEPLSGVTPSWFELVTAAALSWFAKVAVDVAVIEVGLLGRFDATNIVDADVAVITNIGFDHTDGVGDWRRAIASEKAGIIKPGSFLVLGEPDEDLTSLFLAEQPRQRWTRDVDFAIDVDLPAVGGRLVDLRTPNGVLHEIYLPVHGAHQAANASIALAAVEAFFGRALEPEVVEAAFAGLTIPGRLEVVGRAPLVLVDGAHNPSGAEAVAESLEHDFEVAGRRLLVVGMLEGRDPTAMLEAFDLGRYDLVITCTPDSPRAVAAADLAAAAVGLGAEIEIEPDVATAVDRARQISGEDDLILITGSLYVVGAARAHLVSDREQRGRA
jgi:dihydrofolate synthase/folylpolyglutamate synthase